MPGQEAFVVLSLAIHDRFSIFFHSFHSSSPVLFVAFRILRLSIFILLCLSLYRHQVNSPVFLTS